MKVTAAPTGGSIFGGWSGDCAGQGAACTLTMSAAHTAVAHFRPNMNIAFVSDGTLVPGTIGSSLATADAFCASSAKAAFLGGTVWKAWLSTSAATTNINAATHVGASTTGWIRIDGRPFATSMANLQAGKIYYPLRLTELGNDRSLAYAVMSSTNGDGWSSRRGPARIGHPSLVRSIAAPPWTPRSAGRSSSCWAVIRAVRRCCRSIASRTTPAWPPLRHRSRRQRAVTRSCR